MRDNTILEDLDSDIDGDMSSDAVNQNYDIINIKDENNPFHETVRNVLEAYRNRLPAADQDELDPQRALKSNALLAIDILIYFRLD